MKLYWKDYPEARKYELLAEPAARCMTLAFERGRWLLTCLGSTGELPANLNVLEAKMKALEWFDERVRQLAAAVTEIRG